MAILLGAWTAMAWAGGAPRYPANPALGREALFVAARGVRCLRPTGLAECWRALDDHQAFEPVASGDLVLVGTSDGLFALEAGSGRVRWRLAHRGVVFSPAVAADTVYAGTGDGTLYALDRASGAPRWRRRFPGWIYAPAVVGRTLVVGGAEHVLRGLDRDDGSARWEVPLSGQLVYRPVALPGGRAVVTEFDGEIRVLSAGDGARLWSAREPTPSFSPVLAGGVLYATGFGGAVRARRLTDGALLWRQRLADELPFPPRLAGGVLVVGSERGTVSALDARRGTVLWRHDWPAGLIAAPLVQEDDRLVVFLSGGGIGSSTLPSLP